MPVMRPPDAEMPEWAKADPYETKLTPTEEGEFQRWKAVNAAGDTGRDYDLRGAFKAGLSPAENGHWSDQFKKPNHPTFSVESQYAKDHPDMAGHWEGDTYVPATSGRGARPAPPVAQPLLSPDVQKLVDEVSAHGLNPKGLAQLHAAERAAAPVVAKAPVVAPASVPASDQPRSFVKQAYGSWDTKHSAPDRFNKAALEGDTAGMVAALPEIIAMGAAAGDALTASAKKNYSPQDGRIAAGNIEASRDALFGKNSPFHKGGLMSLANAFGVDPGQKAYDAFSSGIKKSGIDAIPMEHPEQAGLVPVPTARPTHESGITRDASFAPKTSSPLTAAVVEPGHKIEHNEPHSDGSAPYSQLVSGASPEKPTPHTAAPLNLGGLTHAFSPAAANENDIASALAGIDTSNVEDVVMGPVTPTSIDKINLGGLPEADPMIDAPPLKVSMESPNVVMTSHDKASRGVSGGSSGGSGGGSGRSFESPFSTSLVKSLAALDSAKMPHTDLGTLSRIASGALGSGWTLPNFSSGSGGSSMAYHPNTGEHVGVSGNMVQTGTYYDSHGNEHSYEMG